MAFQQICNMNNQAARHLAMGNAQKAFAMFLQAQSVAACRSRSTVNASGASGIVSPLSIVPIGDKSSEERVSNIVVPHALQCFGGTQEDKTLCCAVLMFNTALALQHVAEESNKDEKLGKAVAYYKRCLKYLKHASVSTVIPAQLSGLSVAALSNMAQILFDLDRVESAVKLMKMGYELLEQSLGDVDIIDETSMQCIAANLEFFSFSAEILCRAPAAAA